MLGPARFCAGFDFFDLGGFTLCPLLDFVDDFRFEGERERDPPALFHLRNSAKSFDVTAVCASRQNARR